MPPTSRASALCAALAAACAASGPKPTLAPPPEPVATMTGQMRSIENRVRQGQAAKVREEFAAQVAARPNDRRVQFLLAWIGAPSEDAWQQIRKLSSAAPNDPWPRYGIGRIYVRWKMFDQAREVIDKLVEARPDFVPALTVRAELLRERGDLDGARSACEAALKAAPDDVDSLAGLGIALARKGEKDAARGALEKALAKDPDAYEAVAALAALLAAGTDATAAIKAHEKLIELSPTDRAAHLTLAELRAKSGDAAGAAKAYETAIAIAADIGAARVLAGLYRKLGDVQGEIRTLETLARLDPRDAQPHLLLADLKADDATEADRHLKAAAERAPDDPRVRLGLARLFLAREDYIEALANFRAAKAANAADGSVAAAIQAVEKRLQLSPLKGDLKQINREVSGRLDKLFQERLKENPHLSGKLAVKVTIDANGKATEVHVVEDTVHDSVLVGHVYFQLKDAQYPKGKRSPTFEFALAGRGK